MPTKEDRSLREPPQEEAWNFPRYGPLIPGPLLMGALAVIGLDLWPEPHVLGNEGALAALLMVPLAFLQVLACAWDVYLHRGRLLRRATIPRGIWHLFSCLFAAPGFLVLGFLLWWPGIQQT